MVHLVCFFAVMGITWLAAGVAFSAGQKTVINVGVTVPNTAFKMKIRAYQRNFQKAISDVQRSAKGHDLNSVTIADPTLLVRNRNPNPSDTLNALCEKFMKKNVSVIVYLSNLETYGVHTANTLYFLQLANFLGIPVVSWIADNSAMEQNSNWLLLQLSPSIRHQTIAMLKILQRYNWDQFAVVTTKIPGHREFELAVREEMMTESKFRFKLLMFVKVDPTNLENLRSQLKRLSESESRIILLYATQYEAVQVFQTAREFGLLSAEYLWIVTQSVIGDTTSGTRHKNIPAVFPIGLFGVGFNATEEHLASELYKVAKVILHGIRKFLNDSGKSADTLHPNLSCDTTRSDPGWKNGRLLYNYLKKVNISMGIKKPSIVFDEYGIVKHAELNIFNLNNARVWNQIGTWSNLKGLSLYDIVWPEDSPYPPPGKPKRFHLKATFLEELPYIKLEDPDASNQQCMNGGVWCKVGVQETNETDGANVTDVYKCCSGFCVDLLKKLSNDIGFGFDLVRVEDGYWGGKVNGTWNGLIAELINRQTDIVITSLKINSQRQEVIDFSVPFLDTGIAVLVAKRTGIVSPSAFLEPVDPLSWMLLLVVMIHVAALSIFTFEWFSPAGYNMQLHPTTEYRFSFFRAYWLAWVLTFRAAVTTDCPRGVISKLMSNVWAMCTLVFIALYTANLAAFMITREEYFDLSGIEDKRLKNPFKVVPPFRFATVRYGNTEVVIRDNFPEMYKYMKRYNKSRVEDGILAVKRNELDAFIYDSTVLDYLATMDDECRLLTVGSWYAKTGYGIAFPRQSKYLSIFNQKILKYKENGELEKLEKFWFGGACKGVTTDLSSSHPLGIKQFISAFLLVAAGIVLSGIILVLEHFYFRYIRRFLGGANMTACCSLVSGNLGRSLTFSEAMHEVSKRMKKHKCDNIICDNYISKMRRELYSAQERIDELEAVVKLYKSSYPSPRKKKEKPKPKNAKKKNPKKNNSGSKKKANSNSKQTPPDKSEVETFI